VTVASLHKHKIGDHVTVSKDVCPEDGIAFPLGQQHQGEIVGINEGQMCSTCHCTPTDPDHAFDGSLCCPGPWYTVAFTCPAGIAHRNTFAEHELTAALISARPEGI
jgi:hypothetical protein